MAKILLATFESTKSPGIFYELNYDDNHKTTSCSCPGSRYHGSCKHLKLFREGTYPQEHSPRITIMGMAKWPKLNAVYQKI